MKQILIVGAGKEGKGTIGDMFHEAGWQLTFLDKDPQVIENLNSQGYYTLTCYYQDHTETRRIDGYRAYSASKEYDVLEAVINADLIALCLYPEDIASAAQYLGRGLRERFLANPSSALGIISCTNKNHIIRNVQEYFESEMQDGRQRSWFSSQAAVRDVIVRRSANAASASSVELTTKVLQTLLIQPELPVDIGDVKWLEYYDGLETLKDIKILTYNCPHATYAYAGYQKGYETIAQAEKDPEIARLVEQCMEEAVQGILMEYPVSEKFLRDFINAPKALDEEPELIRRVALDPLRKLSRYDRLTANAVHCWNHGIGISALVQSIANGMAYDAPEDPAAVKIQTMIRELGILRAVSHVTGLPEEHPIVRKVAEAYQNME